MSNIPGTNLAAPVVPFTTDDTYATHDSQYGKGGWHEVADTTERDAIPAGRLRDGMIVYVTGDKAYVRESGAWAEHAPADMAQLMARVRKSAFLET